MIAPIYRPAGREESEIEISSENIIEEMRKIMETQGDVIQYKCQQYKTIAEHDLKNELQNLAHENDVILLIGAGSIGDWAKKLLDCNIKN